MADSRDWAPILRRRLTRRALLGAGAATLLGGAGATLLGCEEEAGPRPGLSPGAEGEPRPGGILVQGRSTPVLGLDPHIDLTGLDIDFLLYSYLYTFANEEMIFNNLAESCECADPEHLEFIFKLRPGVEYHPVDPVAGLTVTSEDVKNSFLRRGAAFTIPDKRFPSAIAKLETPDPLIFRLVMNRPFVPAIQEMANPTWAIVASIAMDRFSSLSQQEFGSGPFMLHLFRGAERIALKRHPNFFVANRPLIDGRQWVVIQDNSSLLVAFRSKEHDVNGAVLDKLTAEELMSNPDIVVNSAPNLFYPVLHLKVDRPPFNDLRVRRAIDIGIDRDAIINILGFGEGNYNGPIQWGQEFWALPQQELRAFYRYNPEEARHLLQEANVPNLTLRMKFPELPGPQIISDLALLIKDQLSKIGVSVELDSQELGSFITNLLAGNFDTAFFTQLPYAEPDRPLSFYHSLGVSGAGNWTGLSRKTDQGSKAGFDPQVDDLIEAQQREFDVEKRQQLIREAQRLIIAEHGPQLTLPGGIAYTAQWARVKFAEPTGPPGLFGWDVWLDRA